jgi:transposase InsO family protein
MILIEEIISEEYIQFIAREATPKSISTREVEEASKYDRELSDVRDSLSQAKWNKSLTVNNYFPIRSELSRIRYLVLRGTRLIIPQALRLRCIQLAHEGHLGIVGTKQMLRSKVWWPNMDKEVEHYVKSCHGCQITSTMPNPEPLKPTQLPSGPWEDLAVDLLGPLPSGHYVLVVIDYYSRYYEIDIIKDISSEKIVDCLETMFARNGLPKTIKSDNGPQFVSKYVEQYLKDINVKHSKTIPLHPAANGEVERQNRSLMKRIRIAQAESSNWKTEVRKYLVAYRTKPRTVIGIAPSELMFNRKLRTQLPGICVEEDDGLYLDDEIRHRDLFAKIKNKRYIDSKRNASARDLHTGDSVLVRQSYQNKLSTPFISTP